jgi:hypothetical protein
MAVDINEIVDVQISLETLAVSQEGFGTAMILGDNATFSERIRTYSNIDGVAEDFELTDEEYLAAAAIFSQTVKVKSIKIGRMEARVAQVQVLDFSDDFITGNVIDLEVNNVAMPSVTFDTDHATTAAALEAALEAFDVIGDVVVAGNNFTINAAAAGIPFEITNVAVTGGASQPTSTLTTTVDNHGIAEDLQEISEEDNDWYGLVTTSFVPGDVLQAASWVEPRLKIYMTRTDDEDVLTNATDDIASLLKALDYDRTAVWWNSDTNDFIDAAVLGKNFPFTPGSITWMFKNLNAVVTDNITANQLTNAKAKNVNLYAEINGTDITLYGKMASGQFIDIIHGVDLLQSDVKTEIFGTLSRAPKVPFTNGGVAIIEGVLSGVLERKEKQNFITNDPKYTVSAPLVQDVDPDDRANRHLPDVKFTCVVAGAVHSVTVQGTVSV